MRANIAHRRFEGDWSIPEMADSDGVREVRCSGKADGFSRQHYYQILEREPR